MSQEILIRPGSAAALSSTSTVDDAIGLWISGFQSERTREAYARELRSFAAFAGHVDVASAAALFLTLEDGPAHAAVDAWRAEKLARGLAPASVNRSMAALNSFVAAARRYGLTKLRLEAKGVKSRPYRDTRGPGIPAVQKMLGKARENKNERKAARDVAILRLASTLGLRRAEICELDMRHVDVDACTISIRGKGQTERTLLTLPPRVRADLTAWLTVRGDVDGSAPLFVGLAHNMPETRLTGTGLYLLIRDQLGKAVDVTARPHGLRHTAITAALDSFNGDFRKAQSFSRHASLETIRKYDDNRQDFAGSVAQVVDGLIG
jgi:integrase/recombinase XerC